MATADEVVAKGEDVLASALGLAKHVLTVLTLNRKDPQQLYSVCLYARLFELAYGCSALLEKNTLVGIPILFRSMFEVDIDLQNLLKDPGFCKHMYASFLDAKVKLTKEAVFNESNSFVTEIRERLNAPEELKQTEEKLKLLKDQGYGPLKILDRAKRVEMQDEYKSIYNSFCLDTHNNIRSLECWHLEQKKLRLASRFV